MSSELSSKAAHRLPRSGSHRMGEPNGRASAGCTSRVRRDAESHRRRVRPRSALPAIVRRDASRRYWIRVRRPDLLLVMRGSADERDLSRGRSIGGHRTLWARWRSASWCQRRAYRRGLRRPRGFANMRMARVAEPNIRSTASTMAPMYSRPSMTWSSNPRVGDGPSAVPQR